MSTRQEVKTVYLRAVLTELWISLDVEMIQRKALRKTKRAARNYAFELPLTRGYQTSKCSPPLLGNISFK
jgi:hypothetical protein